LSTLEHCSATFAVAGVSRALLAQYSRHRIGVSLSVQSQRYVSESTEKNEGKLFNYVTPPTIAADPAKLAVYREAMESGLVEKLYITEIKLKIEGDAFFPNFDKKDFILTNQQTFKTDYEFSFLTYSRR
jgi:thymidylate synthase (FAD)